MQFMEPLGVTDSSVDAAWDWEADDWRKDLVEVTRDLAPDVIRWGGLFAEYYRWREGVGPVGKRPVFRNYTWGGIYNNRVGSGEFVDFCRKVGASPLVCVNFLSGGNPRFYNSPRRERVGDAGEAADWVSYANDPDNRERKSHGINEPYNIKLWQIGNETSYNPRGFTIEEAARNTAEFARAMKARDPSIKLIGWGDRDSRDGTFWAPRMLEAAHGYLDFIAMHMMGQSPRSKDTVLQGLEYQKDPAKAWAELNEIADDSEKRLTEFKETVLSTGAEVNIAVTEGHLGLKPRNACPILGEWLCGVFHARMMNSYQRHGDKVAIATAADFCGTRWTVNAVMIQVPGGISYLMPVGSVMRLFKKSNGKKALAVKKAPGELDIAASRTGNTIFLHVANKSYDRSVVTSFAVERGTLKGGRVLEIAPDDLRTYVSENRPDVFSPVARKIESGPGFKWSFPAGSVSAVELEIAS
jgi:alpha-L-arabinofuranosidase